MDKPLIFYCITFSFGIFTSLIFHMSHIMGAVFAASFLAVMFFTVSKKYLLIIFCFYILGAISFYSYFHYEVPSHISKARVLEVKSFSTTVVFHNRKLLLTGKVQGLKEGQRVNLSGQFIGEREYAKGIIGTFKVSKCSTCPSDFIRRLYEVKESIYKKFLAELGDKRTALMMALCFGERKYLSTDQNVLFQKLGVIHVVSVSGFHIALVYKVLERFIGLGGALAVSFVYILFTGLQASTVRAFFMILILKLSKKVFKNYDGLSSLSFAALVLLFYRPYYLLDLGFVLSFLSTLGILLYNLPIQKSLYKLPEIIREPVAISVSAQCFTIPYIAFTIQNMSLGFLLGNLILMPLYTALVLCGNFALIISFFNPLFHLLNKCITIIMIALDGASLIIDKCSPEVYTFSITGAIAIAFIYILFVLYKSGYYKALILPIGIMIILLFENYYFIPVLDYQAQAGGRFIFFYKNEVIVFSKVQSNKGIETENKRLSGIRNFHVKDNEDVRLKISPDFWVRCYIDTSTTKAGSNSAKRLLFEIVSPDKKYVIEEGDNGEEQKSLNEFYDIIRMSVKPKMGFSTYFNRQTADYDERFIFAFERVFHVVAKQ